MSKYSSAEVPFKVAIPCKSYVDLGEDSSTDLMTSDNNILGYKMDPATRFQLPHAQNWMKKQMNCVYNI